MERVLDSYVVRFDGSTLIQNNEHRQIEIWATSKSELQELSLKLRIGVCVKLFGHLRIDCFRVSLDYGGKVDVDVEHYEYNIAIESIIKKILNDYVSHIQDPLLHYLAEYPFRNGWMLNSISKIGASCGTYGKHHSVKGGWLYHVEETLRLIKTDTSRCQINIEIAIVAAIWHDIGKIALVDEYNPSELKIPIEAAIDHERMGLILLGKAVGESNLGMETSSLSFAILGSTIGNIHNKRIFHDYLTLIREVDQVSARFSENNSVMISGFKEAITQ